MKQSPSWEPDCRSAGQKMFRLFLGPEVSQQPPQDLSWASLIQFTPTHHANTTIIPLSVYCSLEVAPRVYVQNKLLLAPHMCVQFVQLWTIRQVYRVVSTFFLQFSTLVHRSTALHAHLFCTLSSVAVLYLFPTNRISVH
jgi:hypothetical protein